MTLRQETLQRSFVFSNGQQRIMLLTGSKAGHAVSQIGSANQCSSELCYNLYVARYNVVHEEGCLHL